MKNKFLLLFLALSSAVMAGERSAQEAAVMAAEFMNQQVNAPARRASVGASAMQLSHTRMKLNSAEPAFYVFNQTNNEGYVVVSADDRTEDVLMYSDNGSLDVEKVNPNLKFWLGRLQEEISAANDENTYTVAEKKARKATTATAISPLLVNSNGEEIAWYQEEPYWNQCPMDLWKTSERCLTGCVATAAAQIMYKWRYPEKGTGSHSYTWECCMNSSCSKTSTKTLSKDFSTVTFDWDNMLATYNSGSTGTTDQKNAVATLMYCCGVACDMGYGGETIGGSGAWTDDMGYGMQTYFGYKVGKFISTYSKSSYQSAKGTSIPLTNCEWSVSTSTFTSYFNTELEAGRPVLMGGEDSDGGHEFVCDGRNTSGYFHINWGWEGDSNNYCLLSALKPSGTSYNFSSAIDALIGLEPATIEPVAVTGVTVAPTSLSLKQNASSTLTATVAPSNATDKSVTWSSSDSKIATVSAAGVVKGVAEGTATITATTTDGSYKATCSVTVSAVSVQQYVKVTKAPDDWSGEYVLVYEAATDTAYVFSGVDAAFDYTPAVISGSAVTGDDLITITIASMEGGYSLKVNGGTNDGKFLSGNSSSNKLNFNASATLNTIEMGASGVEITSGRVLQFNSAKNDKRFRYYTAGGQKPVQLYKLKKESAVPTPVTAITATNAKDTVEIDAAIQLKYTMSPDTATDQRVSFAITSGAEFATLNNGTLTGVAEGDVVVKATALDSLNKGNKLTTIYNIHVKAVKLNTCAEVNAAASGTSLKLNEVTVVYVNGAYVYVKDASGSTLVYKSGTGLNAGDVVSGIKGTSNPYTGLPELKPTNQVADWTITAGDAPEIPAATAVPTSAEVNQILVWKGVTDLEGEFTTSSVTNLTGSFKDEDILFRNNFKLAQTFESTKTYNITGAVATYSKNEDTTIQVYFIAAEEVVAPAVPSDELLNSYAEAGQNLVYAIQVNDSIKCNDIVLVGTYNGWTGDAASCSKFVAVDGYADWYVCCVTDASEDIQAKPVQLDEKGAFSWDYQIGADAAVVRGTATITPGYSNECDIKAISDAAPLLIKVNSWKVDVCASICDTIDYTITAKFPASEIATPQLMGSFNDWATGVAMTPTANPNEYTATVRALCTAEFKFNDAVLGWDNEIRYYNGTAWTAIENMPFGKEAAISIDFSGSDYRWSVDTMRFTLTLNSNDPNLGYVIGGGAYYYNAQAPIAAVCTQSGYAFKEWSDGQTTAGRNVTVTQDITLTAYFDIIKADTVEVHDTTYVPVEVHDTTYVPVEVHDTTYVPVEVHDTTYVPVEVHDTTYVPVEVHDTTYVPVEVHDTTYVNMIEVNSMNPTMGTAILQVYAIPETGYSFMCWSDFSTDNPRQVEPSENPQTFTAVFEPSQPTNSSQVQEDAKSVIKRIVNDHLVIERNGVRYDATGKVQQ